MSLKTSHNRLSVILLLVMLSFTRVLANAQGAGGEIAAGVAANHEKLRQYTYTQKTEVFLKGELKTTKMAQVHFDPATGQKVSVPQGPDAQPESQARGLKGRIIEKKKDEIKEYVERLVGLMGQYLPPNPDKVKAALPGAQVTPPAGGEAMVAFSNYLKQGDKMTLSANAGTKKLDHIAISSSLDNDPVAFDVSFARLPDGTNYPSLTSIKAEAKQLEIRVTTSDYHK